MLHLAGKKLEGAKIAISGFGNVAWGASKKATQLGAKVIAISGPDGVVTIPNGMNEEMIKLICSSSALRTAISWLRSQRNSQVRPSLRARRLGA